MWLRCCSGVSCCRRAGGWALQSLARGEAGSISRLWTSTVQGWQAVALDTTASGDAVISALGCTKFASGTWRQTAAGIRRSTLQAGVGTN